jgi:hypothetical protein
LIDVAYHGGRFARNSLKAFLSTSRWSQGIDFTCSVVGLLTVSSSVKGACGCEGSPYCNWKAFHAEQQANKEMNFEIQSADIKTCLDIQCILLFYPVSES